MQNIRQGQILRKEKCTNRHCFTVSRWLPKERGATLALGLDQGGRGHLEVAPAHRP
jgi:hypothetical protein